ncbi:MAG: CapA family protein [Candidatus Promineifilaceae bacterium]
MNSGWVGLRRIFWGGVLLGCLVLAGCSLGPKPEVEALPTVAATAETGGLRPAPSPTAVVLAAVATNTPLVPTVAAGPTLAPTPTPRSTVLVYYPPKMPVPWQEAVSGIIGRLQTTDPNWAWQLTGDPAAADLVFQVGTDGIPAFQHPIALTVPFTTDWEETSSGQAQDIIQGGHPLVTVTNWEAMPRSFKALRIDGLHPDDPGYPLQQPWSLAAKTGFETAASQLSAELQANSPADSWIHLTAVGDLMLARSLGGAIAGGNLAYPFEDVVDRLRTADITVGNMESSLGNIGEPAPKSYTFQAPPDAAESLALAGFDVVSLANNHAMDYGPEALLQGISLLRQANVAPIGAGANAAEAHTPYIQEVNGLKLAFLGYVNVPVEGATAFDVESWNATENSPGLAWAYPENVTADVTAARQQADLVIVVLHSGFEYVDAPSVPQIAAAHAAIDAGAALVIGHHAHILQGIDFYMEGVIVYGLGNFAFEIDGDPSTAILNVWLGKDGVHQIELIPALIQFGGQPRLAEAWEVRPILQRVYFLTQLLNAG